MSQRSFMRRRAPLVLALLGLAGCPDPNHADDPFPPYQPPPAPEPVDPGPMVEPEPFIDGDRDGTADVADCAPADATRFQEAWLFTDADADGFTVGGELRVCVGTSQAGFTAAASAEPDCDDADAAAWQTLDAHLDVDGDGFGAGEALALCTSGALPAGYVESADDCAPDDPERFLEHWYGVRDADGDSYTVFSEGTLCAGHELPAGYGIWSNGDDCDDANAALYFVEDLFRDSDGDLVGAGLRSPVCRGEALPAGWSSAGGDCAPDDTGAWQLFSNVFRDADGDGVTAGGGVALCGATMLAPGYRHLAHGEDCDDGDAAASVAMTVYVDADQDGAGEGDAHALCNDGSVPSGHVTAGGDCAPGDGARWRVLGYAHVDRDGDGRTTAQAGQLCAGVTLPSPYFATARGNDCDDADAALLGWQVLYPDEDGDGIGAWPYAVSCLGAELPDGFSRHGDDDDDGDPRVGASEDSRIVALW
jgi:hypothetical protein